jgi:hypothetical protein
MSTADAAKKFGFSRAYGFEDFRDRLMEKLAVGSEKILGVSIAKSNLSIEISCWRRGVIGRSRSFVHRSFHMALLKFPSLLRVEITHALGCQFLLYGLGTLWGFSRRPQVRLR